MERVDHSSSHDTQHGKTKVSDFVEDTQAQSEVTPWTENLLQCPLPPIEFEFPPSDSFQSFKVAPLHCLDLTEPAVQLETEFADLSTRAPSPLFAYPVEERSQEEMQQPRAQQLQIHPIQVDEFNLPQVQVASLPVQAHQVEGYHPKSFQMHVQQLVGSAQQPGEEQEQKTPSNISKVFETKLQEHEAQKPQEDSSDKLELLESIETEHPQQKKSDECVLKQENVNPSKTQDLTVKNQSRAEDTETKEEVTPAELAELEPTRERKTDYCFLETSFRQLQECYIGEKKNMSVEQRNLVFSYAEMLRGCDAMDDLVMKRIEEDCTQLVLDAHIPYLDDVVVNKTESETEADLEQKRKVHVEHRQAIKRIQDGKTELKSKRRLPREGTAVLKGWLNEHRDHPCKLYIISLCTWDQPIQRDYSLKLKTYLRMQRNCVSCSLIMMVIL